MHDITTTSVREPWEDAKFSFFAPFHLAPKRFWDVLNRYPKITVTSLVVIFAGGWIFREEFQPYWVMLWRYGIALILALLLGVGMWEIIKRLSTRSQTVGGAFALVCAVVAVVWGKDIVYDTSSFLRYETMKNDIMQRTTPLLSVHGKERLLPLQAVHTRARGRIDTAEIPSPPNYVRVGEKGNWTMAIEPKPWLRRLLAPITQVMSVPGVDSSPDFGQDTIPTHFTIGENLLFSRNTDTCVRRSFDFWRYFNYEPEQNAVFIPDESGKKMVQIVKLTKWSGWLFPWPEFGGVQVIEEGDTNVLDRVIHGCGYWVPPEEIASHKFLLGQNLVPYEVSRFRAASLRFQGGSNAFWDYLAPRWFSRQGDVVIADVPQDMNPLPYALFFQTSEGAPDKIYQYFCMETRDEQTHGLAASFWYPGDGIGPSYVVRHAQLGERLLGCTGVKGTVVADRPEFKGETSSVAEARPYIHRIADANGVMKERFLYMTTLIFYEQKKASEGGEIRFNTSGRLYLSLTDARREVVTWVDPEHPEAWDEQLHQALGKRWAERDSAPAK